MFFIISQFNLFFCKLIQFSAGKSVERICSSLAEPARFLRDGSFSDTFKFQTLDKNEVISRL